MASPARQIRPDEEEVGSTTCAVSVQHGTAAAASRGSGPLHPPSPGPTSMHQRPNQAQAAQHLDPYRTLSLRRDATAAEVTAAYRKLSLLHHPARRRGDGDGDEGVTTSTSVPSDGTKAAASSVAASSSDMFVAVSASYQTLIEPRYRRRYDATTRSKSCTDEETGQHYYPALGLGLSAVGTGGSDSVGVGMGMSTSMSMSMSIGPAASIDHDGERQWDGGCSTATAAKSLPTNPDESFGAATTTTSGSAFDGLVGLGSGVPFHVNSKMRNNAGALDELNTNADGNTDADGNADDATQEGDEEDDGSACWTGAGCGVGCAAASAFPGLELARTNSLDGKEDGDGGPPAVSTSGSSDAAASPQHQPNRNGIFGRRRHLLNNRSPTSIGDDSEYDIGAEALDALFLGPSTDANDIILASLQLQGQQPRMRRGDGEGAISGDLGRHPLPSDGTQDGGQHYTSDQTDLLFGGPLAPLYRARNFAPFHDPYLLFNRIMGSSVFRTDGVDTNRSTGNTGHTEMKYPGHAHQGPGQSASETLADKSGFLTLATLPAPVPPPQTAAAIKTTIMTTGAASFESDSEVGTAESSSVASAHKGSAGKMPMEKKLETKQSPQTIVKRTERVVNGRRMIRTETTVTDPKTGKSRTRVEVAREDIIAEQGEQEKELDTGLSTQKVGPAAQGGEHGVCDRCGAAPVAPEGDAAAFELNPMLCGHYGRETPRGEQLASSLRPDSYRLEEESEDEPLLERVSRQFADFFSCGIGCFAD